VVNIAGCAVLLIVNRQEFGNLVSGGPVGLWQLVRNAVPMRVLAGLALAIALSQFLWLPPFFAQPVQGQSQVVWNGLPTVGHTIGTPDAPIKIEEFTDFQCPWCSKANHVILELVAKHPTKIQLTHRDMAMDMACNPYMRRPYHKYACAAAKYARCAAEQRKFWPFSEKLFENGSRLSNAVLVELAQQSNLDLPRLRECMDKPTVIGAIQADIHEGNRRKITGTPTYFINGEKIVGYRPLEFWEDKVTELLAQEANSLASAKAGDQQDS